MAKRKSATTDQSHQRSGAEERTRQHAAQDALPGMATDAAQGSPPAESPVRAPLVVTRRGSRGAGLEVALRVAPSNGPRQQASARPEPPAAPDAEPPSATPPAPKRPRQTSSRRFGELRDALADGWEIVQPIFARPLWSAADDSQTAFNFVLRRDQATRLLTVPGGRTVERFIATHRLKVDSRR